MHDLLVPFMPLVWGVFAPLALWIALTWALDMMRGMARPDVGDDAA